MKTIFHTPSHRIALALLAPLAWASVAGAAIAPNPRLNAGLQAYGNPASGLSALADGDAGATWNAAGGAWVAYKLPRAAARAILAWNNPSYTWSDYVTNASSCAQGRNLTYPVDYEILTSSNSTNGTDGSWTSRVRITGNKVSSRSHVFETGGDEWIKMTVSAGTGGLDELGIFDASASGEDSWAFLGTSISSNAFKGTPPAQDFAKLVAAGTQGANTPAVVKAGIPCILSTDVSNNLGRYLEFAGSARWWAIEMGTNDAWGGGTGNVQSFRSALQKVIDSAKARGIRVVLARTLATNPKAVSGGWQVDQAFLDAIDGLTRANGLVTGPDLYAWFLAHPEELGSDGVHPNAQGAASIQRLWAEAMLANAYAGGSTALGRHRQDFRATARGTEIQIESHADGIAVSCGGQACSGLQIVGIDGRAHRLERAGWIARGRFSPGMYLLRAEGGQGAVVGKIVLDY